MEIIDKPTRYAEAFICPHCRVHSSMSWKILNFNDAGLGKWSPNYGYTARIELCTCGRCHDYSLWLEHHMIYPEFYDVPEPHPDTPEDVREIYIEAASVLARSGRAACVLLRLALEKLLVALGKRTNSSLGQDVSNLALEQGLSEEDMQAMHIIQLVSNDLIHWNSLIETDTEEVARVLFFVFNYIVNSVYSKLAADRGVREVYINYVPEIDRQRAETRDNTVRKKGTPPDGKT